MTYRERALQSGQRFVDVFVIKEWRRIIGRQRTDCAFNASCWLLCRAAKRKSRVLSVKIECSRDGRTDSPPRRELLTRYKTHPNKRTSHTCDFDRRLNILFLYRTSQLERGEVVRCPSVRTRRLKTQMIGFAAVGYGQWMIPQSAAIG